jgi:hypothetical protein
METRQRTVLTSVITLTPDTLRHPLLPDITFSRVLRGQPQSDSVTV